MAKRVEKKKDKSEDLYKVADGDCLGTVCPICERGSDPAGDDHACRVCGQVFHRVCCENDGKFSKFDLSTMDRAFTNVGWSCLDCDDVVQSVLGSTHQMEICDLFEKYDKNDDGSITFEEYLSTRREAFNHELTESECKEENRNFQKMDRDKSGEIELPEFLAHEAERYLTTYDKETLVRKLTSLEKKSARRIFNLLDRNKDGVIDMWETLSRSGVMGWYSIMQRLKELKVDAQDEKPGLLKKKISIVGQHLLPQALSVRKCDENQDGQVSWSEFLRGHALDIILARPNKSDHAVGFLM